MKRKIRKRTLFKHFVLLGIFAIAAFALADTIMVNRFFVPHTFSYGDLSTRYIETEGTEDLPTLFFLHGASVRAATYRDGLKMLAEKYHVVAPDIPIPDGEIWDLLDYAKYFNQLLIEKDLRDIILIGHSFGGGISANLANITDRVEYLILVDAVGVDIPEYSKEKNIEKAVGKLTGRMKRNSAITMVAMKDYIWNILNNITSLDDVNNIIFESLHKNYDYSNISAPTTILWGGNENEDLIDEVIAFSLQKSIPGSELFFVGGGHDWPLYEYEKFVSMVDDILDDYPGGL